MANLKTISVGDYITFTASTRAGRRRATRKVNGFSGSLPTVRYAGWDRFVVGGFVDDIIHEVHKEKPNG